MKNKQIPEEISELFGKLHLSSVIVYTLFRKLCETQPELSVLADVSTVIAEAERELKAYMDVLLNPQDYENN